MVNMSPSKPLLLFQNLILTSLQRCVVAVLSLPTQFQCPVHSSASDQTRAVPGLMRIPFPYCVCFTCLIVLRALILFCHCFFLLEFMITWHSQNVPFLAGVYRHQECIPQKRWSHSTAIPLGLPSSMRTDTILHLSCPSLLIPPFFSLHSPPHLLRLHLFLLVLLKALLLLRYQLPASNSCEHHLPHLTRKMAFPASTKVDFIVIMVWACLSYPAYKHALVNQVLCSEDTILELLNLAPVTFCKGLFQAIRGVAAPSAFGFSRGLQHWKVSSASPELSMPLLWRNTLSSRSFILARRHRNRGRKIAGVAVPIPRLHKPHIPPPRAGCRSRTISNRAHGAPGMVPPPVCGQCAKALHSVRRC